MGRGTSSLSWVKAVAISSVFRVSEINLYQLNLLMIRYLHDRIVYILLDESTHFTFCHLACKIIIHITFSMAFLTSKAVFIEG